MANDLRLWMTLCESMPHLPRKFWLNPTTGQLDPCGDHASAVLDMGLPGTKEWEEHLAQYADHEDDYDDAIDQNQSDLLELAMNNGWVRGGNEPFLYHNDIKLLQKAARILRDTYGEERILIETGGGYAHTLDGHDLDRFIKFGRLPR
jgi:hypothetical protein